MPLQILIRLSLNAIYVTLMVRQPMTYILLVVLLLHYMDLRIQIGQVVLMIVNLQVVILFSLVRHRFRGN